MVTWIPSPVAGAVKTPSFVIDPPDAAQVTAELLVPCTVAVNCCCVAGLSVAVLGETATRTPDPGV